MLTAHLRPGPKDQPAKQQRGASDSQPAAGGRARAFKGRGVRPQTWNEDDGPETSPRGGGDVGSNAGQQKGGTTHPQGSEAQQQQQQRQQIQMRLVARNPEEVGASHNTFLADQVSPGALSMVSCSTAFSRRSGARGGGRNNGSFNDSDKHLDTLAGVAADLAKRGSIANAELVTGLGREAFEQVSISPGMRLRGNDLAGVSKAIPSEALPVSSAVLQVPLLAARHAAPSNSGGDSVLSVASSGGSGRSGRTDGSKPHVLAPQGSRSGLFEDKASVSPTGAYGHAGIRLDAPSLTVAHAPGQINRPVVVAGSHKHKQASKRASSAAVARGTPAHHTNGVYQGQGGGGVDGEPPFRLPLNMRLLSFGSLASSVASPLPGSVAGGEDWDWQQQQQSEDTSALARRPTTIDTLSTFGSRDHGHSRGENPPAPPADRSSSTAGARSRSSVGAGGDSDDGGDDDTEHRRRSGSSTRRASHREDRISQRRSRSSGSHGGGTRRFGTASGFVATESDDASVRGSSRGRRRMASRSMSGGEGLGTEVRRGGGRGLGAEYTRGVHGRGVDVCFVVGIVNCKLRGCGAISRNRQASALMCSSVYAILICFSLVGGIYQSGIQQVDCML